MTFALDPALPVLLRPDGAVQVGWDPRRAVLVRPPLGLSTAAMATVLRAMCVPLRLADLHRLAGAHGLRHAGRLGTAAAQGCARRQRCGSA